MTGPDPDRTAVVVRERLHALVADVEPAPDALDRILADLPAGDLPAGDLPAGDLPAGDLAAGDLAAGDLAAGDLAAGDLATGDAGTAATVVLAPRDSASRRSRRLPVAAAGGIAAALVVGIGWAVVAGRDGTPSPAGTNGPSGTRVSAAPSTVVTSPAGVTPSVAAEATRLAVQTAFAACVSAGVAEIQQDGGGVVSGPAVGWTAGAHVGDPGTGITIGSAPGGQLAGCTQAGYQYLGVLGGGPDTFPAVAVPPAGRAQQLLADATAAAVGVNLQAGVLAPDVVRATVTSSAGVTTAVDVVDHTYALRVDPSPGTTTAADATLHLFDAAGTETWSGPVE